MSGVETALWLALAVPVIGMGYGVVTWGVRFFQANSELDYIDESDFCPCGASRWEQISDNKVDSVSVQRYRCMHCKKVQVRKTSKRGHVTVSTES